MMDSRPEVRRLVMDANLVTWGDEVMKNRFGPTGVIQDLAANREHALALDAWIMLGRKSGILQESTIRRQTHRSLPENTHDSYPGRPPVARSSTHEVPCASSSQPKVSQSSSAKSKRVKPQNQP